MVTRFALVMSLAKLARRLAAVALLIPNAPASASSYVSPLPYLVHQQQVSNQQKDKSPNRGNGRRELYINRTRITIQ